MPFNFYRTKFFKLLVVFVVCLVMIIFNPSGTFNSIRSAFFFIFSPFQKLAYGTSSEISEIGNFLSSIGQLKSENEKLIKENRELVAQNLRLEVIIQENEELRKQLNILPKTKFNLMGASVIGQDYYGRSDWLEIDRGARDGIEKEMPVIVNSGVLIGKISEVFPTVSKITLLNSTESLVNVLDSKTNSRGIIRGEYGLGIIMDMVLQSEALNKGDEIVTSGIGKNVPPGLLIGTTGEIGFSQDKLFQRVIVNPPVDYSKIRFVFVIMGSK